MVYNDSKKTKIFLVLDLNYKSEQVFFFIFNNIYEFDYWEIFLFFAIKKIYNHWVKKINNLIEKKRKLLFYLIFCSKYEFLKDEMII